MAGTPDRPAMGRVIEAYGGGGFRVDGETYRGSIIIGREGVMSWAVADFAELTFDRLQPVLAHGGTLDILLIGCGPRFVMIAPPLRRALSEAGLVVDAMDTGAACRTYNVLRAEERRVAAALIAVS